MHSLKREGRDKMLEIAEQDAMGYTAFYGTESLAWCLRLRCIWQACI